jgi:hypothetical protein
VCACVHLCACACQYIMSSMLVCAQNRHVAELYVLSVYVCVVVQCLVVSVV